MKQNLSDLGQKDGKNLMHYYFFYILCTTRTESEWSHT